MVSSSLCLPQTSLWLAYLYSLIAASSCFILCISLRALNLTTSLVSRKLLHLITGPLFCCLFVIFPRSSVSAPYLASTIPLASAAMFGLIGYTQQQEQLQTQDSTSKGGYRNQDGLISLLVQTVSREGRVKELTRGPFYYGIIHSIISCIYWTYSPIGLISCCILCVGDGLADLCGRAARSTRLHQPLPWNKQKTLVGSTTMFFSSLLFAYVFGLLYLQCGYWPTVSQSTYLQGVVYMSIVATLVESLPIVEVDNLTVFVSGVLVGHWCFPSVAAESGK